MNFDREITESELALLEAAGASEDFVTFVDIYPESSAGRTVLGWFERGTLTDENAADGQPYSGGHFFDTLWNGDAEGAFGYADSANKRHLETLFGHPVRSRLLEVE